VKKTSLAEAKAHLSELVDAVEHRGRRILIHRHGKPAAALVPVAEALPRPAPRKPMTDEEALAAIQPFLDEFGSAEPEVSAVEDLLAGRR
jgi:prevent-host-death family protein